MMTQAVIVKVRSPVESALSKPKPVVKRCLNCSSYKCDKIKDEPNALKVTHDTYVETDCDDFSPIVVMIKNDEREIENLKRFCTRPSG